MASICFDTKNNTSQVTLLGCLKSSAVYWVTFVSTGLNNDMFCNISSSRYLRKKMEFMGGSRRRCVYTLNNEPRVKSLFCFFL